MKQLSPPSPIHPTQVLDNGGVIGLTDINYAFMMILDTLSRENIGYHCQTLGTVNLLSLTVYSIM